MSQTLKPEEPVEEPVVEEPVVEKPVVEEPVVEEPVVEEPVVEEPVVEEPVVEEPVVEEDVVLVPAGPLPVDQSVVLTGDVKAVYDEVKPLVDELVAGRQLTATMVRPLIIKIIQVIEKVTGDKYDHIDGAQKREIALSVINHIIVDLQHSGNIDRSVADGVLMGLEFLGPSIIDFAAAFVKKIFDVVDDVADNGCQGCFSRNFRRKKVDKKAGKSGH